MVDPAAIRRAILEVEQAIGAARARGEATARDGASVLARLYTVYAQSVLNAHGVAVDLDDLCCRSCRSCGPGLCVRDQPGNALRAL
ncbi:hypothetical protein [Azospirillum sp. TSO35-2]|uniref:hypothetical protein n=1 Tax=Azospirillum sp. TSO35-2 TaxID=716796 RepID=UPI000D611A00|nr:hypothetical protein [Azospirillum sp. TSO35-2]PWC34046.1 hypothetical protein TSO352_27360 [Azospirillum sp. TSO35-2]